MFDIAFSEMLIIAVIALVVIGPEKLPRVAKTVGHLLGRAQRYVGHVKSEINREMELEELRKVQIEMQASARKLQEDMQYSLYAAQSDLGLGPSVNQTKQVIERDGIAELDNAALIGPKMPEDTDSHSPKNIQ